jgi:uncharacterized protein YqfA (UPF0365 family)
MKYNTITRAVSETVPSGVYEGIDFHGSPPDDVAERAGWVDVTPEIQAIIDADKAQADAQAAEAQAQAEYQASLPVPMPTGIEAPVVVLTDSDGKGWGVVADGGDLITYADHASPRPDAAVIAERQAQARADNQAHRARIEAIKTDLDQVEAALDQVDVTTTGTLGVAIAATTGVNKTALTETRKVLVDLKAAAKNLRQAAEKLRRDVK